MLKTAINASVVLTRPKGKNESLALRLSQVGCHVQSLPALDIKPLLHADSELADPEAYDLVVFVSSHAASFYLDALIARDPAFLWPAQTIAATVGAGSAGWLYRSGLIPATHIVHPSAESEGQDSEALWTMLQPELQRLRRVLIVRGESGREWLGQQLDRAGARVERLAVYARTAAHWNTEQASNLQIALASAQPCTFLLTSAESVDAVHANIQRLGLKEPWTRARFVVIHERVASRLHSLILASGKVEPPVINVCAPSDDAIFGAIVQIASL